MISAGGSSAYQMFFGSNPIDLLGWEDNNGALVFAQDTSSVGQFVQQRKLRMRAQEATVKEVANSKLRRLRAYNKSYNSLDINIGDSALFFESRGRNSLPRWREPAEFLDADETGATVTFRGRAFKVARLCVRNQLTEKDVSDEARQNSLRRGDPMDGRATRRRCRGVCPGRSDAQPLGCRGRGAGNRQRRRLNRRAQRTLSGLPAPAARA